MEESRPHEVFGRNRGKAVWLKRRRGDLGEMVGGGIGVTKNSVGMRFSGGDRE